MEPSVIYLSFYYLNLSSTIRIKLMFASHLIQQKSFLCLNLKE